MALGTTLTNLATFYQEQGRYADAEPLWRRILQMAERVYGLQDPHLAMPLQSLSETYIKLGKTQEAAAMSQRAREVSAQP
jgi:tetratricopeptide (TPR) repeat protein